MAVNADASDTAPMSGPAGEVAPHTVNVVGFSGSVSEGATAIKSPVFEIDGRYFSGDPDAPPPRIHTYGREQIEEYQERGLLSLVSDRRHRAPGYVFIYAQASFLHPTPDAYDLTCELDTLWWDKRLGAYCDYMHRDRAVALLGRWGEVLLSHAKRTFKESNFLEAKESAMRARFGATREHLELRKEAHCYVAAARLGLDQEIHGVIRNVAIDFSKEEADRVELRARGLLNRLKHWKSSELAGYREQARFTARFAMDTTAARAA